jgi:hypothetical protein
MVMTKTKTNKVDESIIYTKGVALSNVFQVHDTNSVSTILNRLGFSTVKEFINYEEVLQIKGDYVLKYNPKDIIVSKFVDGTYFSLHQNTFNDEQYLQYVKFVLEGLLMSVEHHRQKASGWSKYEALERVLYDKKLVMEYNIIRDIRDGRLDNIEDNVAIVAHALIENNLLGEEDYISYLQRQLRHKNRIDITIIAEPNDKCGMPFVVELKYKNNLKNTPHKVYRMHIDKYDYACIELPNKFIV